MSKEINILNGINIYKAKIYSKYIILFNYNNTVFKYFPLISENQCLIDNIIFYIKPIPYEKLLDSYPENTYYICDQYNNAINLNYGTNYNFNFIHYDNNYVILNFRCGSTALTNLEYISLYPKKYKNLLDNKYRVWDKNSNNNDMEYVNNYLHKNNRENLINIRNNDTDSKNNYYMIIFDNFIQMFKRKINVVCWNKNQINRTIDYYYLSNIDQKNNIYTDKHTVSMTSMFEKIITNKEINRLKLFKLSNADNLVKEVFKGLFDKMPKHNVHRMSMYNFELTDKQYKRMYEIYSIDNEIYNGKYTKYIIG